ncbi:uncharacterized protein LOC124870810 isoform X2 [Girardinichthys multiradiatus]|uniref:uncharacterized protein LOC124870810 isoform X2 n=1 Tax=Girardinichthys multiradiatus TaxID=208333 RepID=UPI001FAC8BFC|nr:uncharacterized protein LOC124870810 isoform X2 [Girardinichthys multiradiatus]
MNHKKEKKKGKDNFSVEEFNSISRCFQETRSALIKGDKTLESLSKRRTEDVKKDNSRTSLIESIQEQHRIIRSAVEHGEKSLISLQERMVNTQEALEITRRAADDKDEELKSFKDRVAEDFASSIQTGKAINLNNPVSKPRLIELYDELRFNWKNFKTDLISKRGSPKSVIKLIQQKFMEAKADMEKKRKEIEDVFGLNTPKRDPAPLKVKEYCQLSIQNLQRAIYSEKQEGLKYPTLVHKQETLEDVMNRLGSECYWLGRLMALNYPPLEPDWENPTQTLEMWNILPQCITESQKNEQDITYI